MPTNLYGPNDNYHPTHSHVLPALIRRFHEAKEQGLTEVSSEEYNEYVDTQVKETNAYYEATETKDSDGNILKVSKSDIVDSYTNGKEGVKKAIVLNRAIEWLGAHITEK